MEKYLVGFYDDYRLLGDALIALKSIGLIDKVSFIGKEVDDSETEDRLTGDEELALGEPYTGSLTGSTAAIIGSIKSIPVSGIGTLTMAGPLSDIIAATSELENQKTIDLKKALKKANLEKYSDRYFSTLIAGQALLFVPVSNKREQVKVNQILADYGVLDKDLIEISAIT